MALALSGFIVLLCAAARAAMAEEGQEPMVAFLCNQPAMYSTEHGLSWVKDDSTGCLKDPADILNYCRKVFPTLDVRNVVESTTKVTIDNWCDYGVSLCDKKFTVRPFRCLVGAFQSDALLVPEHCVFDHVHNAKLCTSFDEWNQTAVKSCVERDMVQQSFAMLQPCGLDKFNGVEFVCCPNKQDMAGVKDRETVPVDKVKVDPVAQPSKNRPVAPTKLQGAARRPAPPPAISSPVDVYVNGAERGAGHRWNEHDYFVKAKSDMQKRHHDKVTKMMKEWADARKHVEEMKLRDPKKSEKLNKEITGRFQKLYEAEEMEGEMEKKQLAMLHQQRVQAELNERKEKTRDNYVDSIEDDETNVSEILKALRQYVKALQKDRIHSVNHYQHLESTDPEEAERSRAEVADHLRAVDKQLN